MRMTRQSVKCQTTKKNCHSENYRWQIIAEIIYYGRADCKIESIFQDQIKCWSNVLSEIPTEELFSCYISALRDRDEMRDAMFDERSLMAGEMLVAWNKNKKVNHGKF